MHTEDGTAVYLSANLAPVSLTLAVVQREIEILSRTIHEQPTLIQWVPVAAPTSSHEAPARTARFA